MSNAVAAHFALATISSAERANDRALRILEQAAALRASKGGAK